MPWHVFVDPVKEAPDSSWCAYRTYAEVEQALVMYGFPKRISLAGELGKQVADMMIAIDYDAYYAPEFPYTGHFTKDFSYTIHGEDADISKTLDQYLNKEVYL